MTGMFLYSMNLIVLLLAGFVLIRVGYRNMYSRWTGIMLLVSGCINFTYLIHFSLIPLLEGNGIHHQLLIEGLTLFSIPWVYIYFYLIGYAFLMSSIHLAEFIPIPFKKMATWTLLIPIPLLISTTGDYTFPIHIDMVPLRFMVHFYTMIGLVLLGVHLLQKRHTIELRKNGFYIFLLFLIVLSENLNYYSIHAVNILPSSLTVERNPLWTYNMINSSILFIALTFFGIRQGIWGIRLRFEQERQEYSMRAISEGTNIVNHTIKNELQKINYLNERVMAIMSEQRNEEVTSMLHDMRGISNHLLTMTQRMKERADDIRLQKSAIKISGLISSVVSPLSQHAAGKGITISISLGLDGILNCDELHVREALNNLCMNAIDEMPTGGEITIRTKLIGRHFAIEVKDEGTGIDEQTRSKVFDPFFTTKKNTTNYGLGLSYCFNVMKKHGGEVRIVESSAETGTTFALVFPGKTLLKGG